MHGTKPVEIDAARLIRSFDGAEINTIVNDPRIFPLVVPAGSPHLDLAPLIADPRHVLLLDPGRGGFLFVQDAEPGIYEVHTNFLPEFRGKYVVAAAHAAATWMFTHTDAMILQTRIPAFNKAALVAIKWCGFKFWFTRPQVWPTEQGLVDVKFYRRTYEDWIDDGDELVAIGEGFHAKLDAEYERHQRAPHSHPHDEAHDRYVGTAFRTIAAGQIDKAVILYNRWARPAGYAPITIASRSPLILDIIDALLLVTGDTFKVIKCK